MSIERSVKVGDFAELDLDRLQRRQVSEVIFGEGKRPHEVAALMERLVSLQGRALTTRVSAEAADQVSRCLAKSSSKQMPELSALNYDAEGYRLWNWALLGFGMCQHGRATGI